MAMIFPDLLTKKLLFSCPEANGIHNVYKVDNAYTCRNCRHFLVEIPASDCRNHHYHLNTESSAMDYKSEKYKCCSCFLEIDFPWKQPILQTFVLQQSKIGLLDILLVYFQNVLNGNSMPINSENKFLSKVMDENGLIILNKAGYKLQNGFWVLIDSDLKNLIQVKLEILIYMGFNNMHDILGKYNLLLEKGLQILARKIGVEGNLDFEKFLEKTNQGNQYYEKLGILSPSFYSNLSQNSTRVENAYKQCIKEDSNNISVYLEALLEIAKIDSDLEIFALMERSKGIPTFSELKDAYNVLGESSDASDYDLLSRFTSVFSNIEDRREALKVIAVGRDSLVISHFLETGIVISNNSKDVQMTESCQLL